jgi:ferric-dicitrate binding protein FerR (iron transport regulator)
MSGTDRKEQRVRELLAGPHPTVPPQLAERAAARGRRQLRRRLVLKVAVWVLLLATLVGLAVWAGVSGAWLDSSPTEESSDFGEW